MDGGRRIVMPATGEVAFVDLPPAAPGNDEIQVEIHYSAISPGTERALLTGLAKPWLPFPFPLGYSAAGRVVAVGAEAAARGFAVGQRVACKAPHGNWANVSVTQAVRMPDGLSYSDACLIELGNIASQAVRKVRIELGETVIVQGLGVIGQLAVQLARAAGAGWVVGLDAQASRLEMALAGGADEVRNITAPDWRQGLRPAEVVFEATGLGDAVPTALGLAERFGRVVLLGSARQPSTIDTYSLIHTRGLQVIGAHVGTVGKEKQPGRWPWLDEAANFLALAKNGRLRLSSLRPTTIKPNDAIPYLIALRDGHPSTRDAVLTLIHWA